VKTLLLFAATVGLWAQTEQRNPPAPPIDAGPTQRTPDPNPQPPIDAGAQTDPVSKTGPVSAIPEPELACAGNRPELLDYPNSARTAGVDGTVIADYTVTMEGKLKDVKFTSTVKDPDKAKLFEDSIRLFLEQSDYPPGCEKAPKQIRFEFFFKGQPSPERKTSVEFKTPAKFEISVNPDLKTPIPPANSADRTRK